MGSADEAKVKGAETVSQQVKTSSYPTQKIVCNAEQSIIYLPTQVLISNPISVKQDYVVQYIQKPGTPLLEIAEFAISQSKAGFIGINLAFEIAISQSYQERWTNLIAPVVSAIMRELSDGEIWGVTPDRTVLEVKKDKCVFVKTQEALVTYLAKNASAKILEFTYSPNMISIDSMRLMMKNFEAIKTQVEKKCGLQLGALRKMGEFKSFTVLVALYYLTDVEECLKYKRLFFSELIFDAPLKEARDFVNQQIKQYATKYILKHDLTPMQLNLFSEVMSLENDQLREYMLVRNPSVPCRIDLVKADSIYRYKCADLYTYLINSMPAIYKAQVELIYHGKIVTQVADVPQTLIDYIVDATVYQYIFSPADIINVDLSQLSGKVIVEWLSQISLQIYEQLLGEDKCEFGTGLDGEPFIKVVKVQRPIAQTPRGPPGKQ